MPKRLILLLGLLFVAAVGAAILAHLRPTGPSPGFVSLMNLGNGLMEKGSPSEAAATYRQALQLSPESSDVRLNLANACLQLERPQEAEAQCREALELSPNSAAAYYLLGCSLLRENRPEQAVQAFQQSWKIEPNVPALNFEEGMAEESLGHVADAIRDFEAVIRSVPGHPSAHFQLSRLYKQLARDADAGRELAKHQEILVQRKGAPVTMSELERCPYTRPLAPFVLAQPDTHGLAVRFVEDTAGALGALASECRGPVAVIDYDHDGRPSLFVQQKNGGFALLDNRSGRFSRIGRPLPASVNGAYRASLVGDVDNDGFEDVVVLGERDSRLFKFYAHGRIVDATRAAGLDELRATSGMLADLDFTGNLDLVAVEPGNAGLAVYRNLGNLSFDPGWTDSGLPAALPGACEALTEDWGNEGLPGVFIARAGSPPAYYTKRRAGAFEPSAMTAHWPKGAVMATGDLANDLHPQAVVATDSAIEILDRARGRVSSLPLHGFHVAGILLEDIDNDGWLDILAFGPDGIRVWRNTGHSGFADVTRDVGLEGIGPVSGMAAASFAGDGGTDLVTSSDSGLRFFRNQGAAGNLQLRLRLTGNRSNASALGMRVEVVAGDWRTSRTVRQMPLDIGVGRHGRLDAVRVHWFDLSTAQVDVPVERAVHPIVEPTLPSGSCPYLYAWDGHGFRFVTDILGAAPLGLPVDEKRFVPADPEELLALGGEEQMPARDGAYEIRITDELREVLYLDEASLVAVDHPRGTLVLPTSKMHPSGPFPAHELWTLRPLRTPRLAVRSDGLDVTDALARIDGRMAAPARLRRAQLRGLAEPFSVTLDFGPLPADRPLVLALTGWIHFGGGMANVAGSIDPTLPFPFPVLDAEQEDGTWRRVDVDVGTPAGKTKTILVDLGGKLTAGTKRLRISSAYEIYWDCALLCEKAPDQAVRRAALPVVRTDLHWRGFSQYADLPASLPLTPLYDRVSPVPPWDRTPSGWFTRYGPVDDLVARRDDRLVLMAGGDELSIRFDAAHLPPPGPGLVRDFFLHVVGWDKDADFHIGQGWRLEPLPFQGMDDQAYGREPRPGRLDDAWIREYDTRWVDPLIVAPGSRLRSVP